MPKKLDEVAYMDLLEEELAELETMVHDMVSVRTNDPHLVFQDKPDPVEWAERVSGTELDDWQREIMVSTSLATLLMCHRQAGKSHVVSLRAAYRAMFLKRRVGVLSPTLRQSGIIYRRALTWLKRAGIKKFVRETSIELELPNGGAVIAFPGDRPDLSIRGDTLDDLIVDEASRIKDSLIAAATPTTATKADASIIYLTTPAGQRGEFYRAWKEQEWWDKIEISVDKHAPKRITARFLERERKRLGIMFEQEYNCQFLAAPGGIFTSEQLDEIFGESPTVPKLDDWLPKADAASEGAAWLPAA
jgi:hypothetical protein